MDYSEVKAAADWLDMTGTLSTIKKLKTADIQHSTDKKGVFKNRILTEKLHVSEHDY